MLEIIFQNFVPKLLELVGGASFIWWVTEFVKSSKFVSFINSGQTKRILAFVGTLSTVLGGITTFANDPSAHPEMAQQAIVWIISAASMWYGAHTLHKGQEKVELPSPEPSTAPTGLNIEKK